MAEPESWEQKQERLRTGPRLRALEDRLSRLEEEDASSARRTLRAVQLLLVDATLDGDTFTLDAAVDGLQRLAGLVHRKENSPDWLRLQGRLDALSEQSLLALERLPSLAQLANFRPDSQSARFLRAVSENPGADSTLITDLLAGAAESTSRVGRQLQQTGLVRKRKVGRHNAWDITPRGTQLLQLLESGPVPRPRREHRQPAMG